MGIEISSLIIVSSRHSKVLSCSCGFSSTATRLCGSGLGTSFIFYLSSYIQGSEVAVDTEQTYY